VKRAAVTVIAFFIICAATGHTNAGEAVSRKVLDNGLVILVKKSSPKDLVTINACVRAAPKYEGRHLGSGISHLVEHMLFKGTLTRKTGDIEKEMRSCGGIMSGSACADLSSYEITIPAKHLEQALALLKDMLANASFDAQELEKEKEVVLKEILLDKDDPEKSTMLSLFFNSYIRHPYRYPAIGYADKLKALTRDDVIKYYESRYVPNNIVVAIVGDVDERDAAGTAEKQFSGFRNSVYGDPANIPQEPLQTAKRYAEEEMPAALSYLAISFHSTPLLSRDLCAMDVLSMILGRGNNSRLNAALVENKRIAHSVSATNYTPEDAGLFVINAVTDEDKIAAASKAVIEEIRRLREEDVSAIELSAAKKTIESGYVLLRETIAAQAKDLGENELLTGNHDFSSAYIDGIRAVTAPEVRRAALRYLNETNMTEVRTVPKTEHGLSGVNIPKPSYEEKTQVLTLPNGLTVLARRDSKVPAVAITIAFSGGLLAEDKNSNGISNFTAKMLLDGTKHKSSSDIHGIIENAGGEINTFSGFNSFGVNITVLKDDLDKALGLAKEIVTSPEFPQDEIEKERMLTIASIKEEDDDIFEKGVLLVRKGLFDGHPYSMRYSGEASNVTSFTRNVVKDFWSARCVPNNTVISVSGDIDAKNVFDSVSGLFGAMEKRELPKTRAALAAAKAHKTALKMDKDQTLVMLGFRTCGVTDTDRYALDVLDTLFSGISGRLFTSIRSQSGLSYALGCTEKLGLDSGFFLFYVSTTRDRLDSVKEKLIAAIKAVRDVPVTEDELAAAKKEAISAYKIFMQTNSAYSFHSALDTLYGLGYDNIYKYKERIKKVTASDIRQAALKYFDLNTCSEVIIEPE
jgi:zinc protease